MAAHPLSSRSGPLFEAGRIVSMALIGIQMLMAVSAGAWIAAVLALGAILLLGVAPFLLADNRRAPNGRRQDPSRFGCLITTGAVFLTLASIISLGAHAQSTPEGRAKSALNAKERRIETAMDEARERAAALKEQTAERVAEEEERAAEEKERNSGLQCLNGWSGAYPALVDLVKPAMRNPDSFDHVETRITPRDGNGQHRVLMTFRAENGFGGMNIERALALVEGDDCRMISWEIDG